MMRDRRGRGGAHFARFLRAGSALHHVTLRQQRNKLLGRLGRRNPSVDKINDAEDEKVKQRDEKDPFPEIALLLGADLLQRVGLGTPLQIQASLPRIGGCGGGQAAGLGITGSRLHDLVVLYIVVWPQ